MGGKGIQLQVEKMRESAVARARCGEKSGLEWRGLNLVPKVFGLCAAPCGTKADEPTQTRKDGHERVWKEKNNESSHLRRESGPDRSAR